VRQDALQTIRTPYRAASFNTASNAKWRTPSPPSEGREGWGEEGIYKTEIPLALACISTCRLEVFLLA